MRRLVRTSVSLVAIGLLVPVGAAATVVTLGNPSPPTSPGTLNASATWIQTALPGATLTAPADGVIIRWRIVGASGGPFMLRVLTHNSGVNYTGAGTSAPETPTSTATQTFATSLPIKAGQTIAFDNTNSSDQLAYASAPGASYGYFSPPLAENSSGTAISAFFPFQFGFNADLALTPSNADTLGGVKRNKDKGTATLSVNVPGPGTLTLTGKGVKTQRAGRSATASMTVTAAGTVKLLVKAKGKARKQLNKRGKAKVKVTVSYTPYAEIAGVTNTQTRTIKLVKSLG